MAQETIAKIKVLADFGFGSREPVDANGQQVAPRDLLEILLSSHVPPITDYLAPAENQPPDWVEELSTEVRGRKNGQDVSYRVSTLTCNGLSPLAWLHRLHPFGWRRDAFPPACILPNPSSIRLHSSSELKHRTS